MDQAQQANSCESRCVTVCLFLKTHYMYVCVCDRERIYLHMSECVCVGIGVFSCVCFFLRYVGPKHCSESTVR